MYEIKFVFSLTEEKFLVTRIVEKSRNIKMSRSDFDKKVWGAIQDIGNVLTANLFARGGAMAKNIAVSHSSLMQGAACQYKSVLIS